MLVNVIMAYRNTKKELVEKSLQSLAAQSYKNIRLIVVDDNSTDENHQILTELVQKYAPTAFMEWMLHRDKSFGFGPGPARERGLKATDLDCEFCCFLDSDDYLTEQSIELRVTALLNNSNAVAVYGNKYTEDLRQNPPVKTLEIVPNYDQNRLLNGECYIPSNSVMFRVKYWTKYIGYMLDTKLAEDYNLWLKLILFGEFIKINNEIYTQTIHGDNITLNKEVLAQHRQCLIKCFVDFNDWASKTMKAFNANIR